MKRLLSLILIFIFCISLYPLPVQAEFNPSYILSDAQLVDYSSMNTSDIQTFLNRKGSFLADYKTIDYKDGSLKPASEIIYNASFRHEINPQYLLVLLQKEQSLIQGSYPNDFRLNWATGYAMCDSCSVNTPGISEFSGFSKQVDFAAKQMRKYIENPYNYNFKKGNFYTISGQEVLIANQATAALYNYTPHIHGNKNFWKIWTRWFIQEYPDGSLLKAHDSPTVWYIHYGRKQAIKNMSVLESRFSNQPIITVSPETLDIYDDGPMLEFAEYSLLEDNSGTIYMLSNNTLRPFKDNATFAKFGFNPEEKIFIDSEVVLSYDKGEIITVDELYPFGVILKSQENGDLYYINNNKKSFIYNSELKDYLYAYTPIREVENEELNQYSLDAPVYLPNSSLIKSNENPTVYLIENGFKRPFLSGETFESKGYQWDSIHIFSQELIDFHPTGSSIK